MFKFWALSQPFHQESWTWKVPVTKDLLTGTVPVNKELLTGTVPVNKYLLTGTFQVDDSWWKGWKRAQNLKIVKNFSSHYVIH